MEVWEAIVLGLVQGLTEFLPVSSSGHLQIFNTLFGLQGEGEPDVCRGGACRYGLQYDRRVPQGIVAVDRRFFPVQMEFGDYLYF